MIAALTKKIIQQYGADPQRVYIAGLSAGGAMAAVMAGLTPKCLQRWVCIQVWRRGLLGT